jgi:hypothetical protein
MPLPTDFWPFGPGLRPVGGGVRAVVDFDVLAGGRYNSFLHRAIH